MKELPDKLKMGEKYDPAMQTTEQADADDYFQRLVERTLRLQPGLSREQAEGIERQSLGYYAGYYDNETRARVERLFHCAHPFFGKIEVNGPPTAEQAFSKGLEAGARQRRQA
jgi:hypothetical protein